mgnify:CR=1 FL=1
MTDLRQIPDLLERRRACARINELRFSCEKLAQVKDRLLAKLDELNEIADKLIDEKQDDKIDPTKSVNLISYNTVGTKTGSSSNRLGRSSSCDQNLPFATNDPTDKSRRPDALISSSLSRPRDPRTTAFESQPFSSPGPTNAFKLKLAHYIEEVAQKIEELNRLSEHLPSHNDITRINQSTTRK